MRPSFAEALNADLRRLRLAGEPAPSVVELARTLIRLGGCPEVDALTEAGAMVVEIWGAS